MYNSVQQCTTLYLVPRLWGALEPWFLTLLEVLNPASFISALADPFIFGQIKYDFFKT